MTTNGYPTTIFHQPVKRYCRFMEIKNNPSLITLYKEYHSQQKHWKEIRDGIRSVGILEMEMYIVQNKVMMIVETGLDFDWEMSMNKLASLPRQNEWEQFVATFQGCDPHATSTEKWMPMERMFYLYND